jgi:hypothetical protein
MILNTGRLPPRDGQQSAFVAYFAHPNEVVPLCQRAGFEVRTVLGVEGVVSMIEDGVNALSGAAWETWVDLNHQIAEDPSLHGGAEHLLVVAHRPRWRAVLRQIAQRLHQAGLAYKVVGGASAALGGVPLAVKDIDVETDAEDAHRFQSLFPDQVVQPVSLRKGEVYRSHFGHFDFEGVPVDVMGDLHRREGKSWVPTGAQTENTVDLDGVPARTSWLEEETLAYIRRGRLERAARCLPYCDQGRLLSLLRGDHATDVL